MTRIFALLAETLALCVFQAGPTGSARRRRLAILAVFVIALGLGVPTGPASSAGGADEARFQRNDLATAASPFLQQHADNPIHWQRWDDAVLAYAKRAGKPIFLSVGYSACYWCHVMERESFEDAAIAAYLNANFVSILVDREDRPDIDYLYQNALYAMTGGGGWPLNMFLDSDGAPFWGGTYFPDVERHGMKPFIVFLKLIVKSWTEDRAQITEIGRQLRESFAREANNPGAVTPDVVARSAVELLAQVDVFFGGFGDAPKYPQPQNLEVLWRAYLRTGQVEFGDAVRLTLRAMVRGGLNDHLRGGFARYAVDQDWRQPHFEKMLYTNASLLRLLTLVWQHDGDAELAQAIRSTAQFVLSRMRLPGAAFGSSFDAETEEGLYYLWTADEVDQVLGPAAAMFKAAYDVTDEGAFKPEADWLVADHQRGASVLFRTDVGQVELARLGGVATGAVDAELEKARRILRAHRRSTRTPPSFDDKVLADWNGLMIRALAEAGFALSEPAWIDAAIDAFDYIQRRHGRRDGQGLARLAHTSRGGAAYGAALIEDYAQMTLAALALFEVTGQPRYRAAATAWVETALSRYWDAGGSGFFQNADDSPGLIIRVKADFDGELPAGNGAMAEALARLYFFSGDATLARRAEAALESQGGAVGQDYFSLGSLLIAADTLFRAVQVVVIGDRGQADTAELLNVVARLSLPGRVLQVISPAATLPDGHPAQYKTQVDGKATVYVCVGQVCSLPATTAAELRETVKLMRRVAAAPKTTP